ncbi:MAG TPA: hypothetical protein VLK33_21670 [Terriglobales bacterium]|nr:hypothetical protein [Terriglobales bacterium]
MKKTFVWTAILFLLTSIVVPTAVMADGNPRCGGNTCPSGGGTGGGH